MKNLFAPITHADFIRARNELNSLTMFKNELVSAFIPRFHKRIKNMVSVCQENNTLPSQFEYILMLLDKLERGVTNPDQRTLLTNYRVLAQGWTDKEELPFTLTSMELALAEVESRMICRLC